MEICKQNSGTNFFYNISRNTQSTKAQFLKKNWIFKNFEISWATDFAVFTNIQLHSHDLETNATKEWHVRNIITLLEVITYADTFVIYAIRIT
ncbi:hypothetical protein T07_291 [Trichinella nelsoni]|uniref:Uncharacterized protein n=1 Tax=Trichinella nelsoni TaxID=6336 RepID=A0A0V0S5H0_9BILA|nr:hypothetical protein T07_291 [Trichinella nelsoni]